MPSMVSVTVRVTRNGQVSLPAKLRHRWGVVSVLVIDRGDYAIVRPIPLETVTALRGVRSGPGPSAEQARATERADDRGRPAARKPR